MSDQPSPILVRLAGRASGDHRYFGWLLERYRSFEHLSASALAARLGLDAISLVSLALCRRPRSEHFAADVAAVAAHLGADVTALVSLVRHVETVEAMAERGGLPTELGFLLAARTREVTEAAEPNVALRYDREGANRDASPAERVSNRSAARRKPKDSE